MIDATFEEHLRFNAFTLGDPVRRPWRHISDMFDDHMRTLPHPFTFLPSTRERPVDGGTALDAPR